MDALYVEDVVLSDNGMHILMGMAMPRSSAEKKADLKTRIEQARAGWNTTFREELFMSDEDSAQAASKAYEKTIGKLQREFKKITGETRTVECSDSEYKPGMVYLLQ